MGFNQGINILYPLILFPLLIRNVGMHLFGEYAIVLSLTVFCGVIIDFGFNVTAVRDLSATNDKLKEALLFSKVLAVKSVIFLVLLVPVSVASWLISPGNTIHVFAGAVMMLAGMLLNPVWYLLSKQKVGKTIAPNIIIKSLTVLLCILVVNQPGDYILVYYITGGAALLYGVYSLLVAIRGMGFNLRLGSRAEINAEFRKGWSYFLSNLGISFYTQVIVMLLAVFASKGVVGQYAIAEKIVALLRQVAGVFSQSFFAVLCNAMNKGSSALRQIIRREFALFMLMMTIATIILFVLSPQVIRLLTGAESTVAVQILRIICFIPLVVAANIPFYQLMLIRERKRSYLSILGAGCIAGLVGGIVLIGLYEGTGAAWANLLTETVVTVLLVIKGARQEREIFFLNDKGLHANILPAKGQRIF